VVIRDSEAAAREAFGARLAHNGTPDAGKVPELLGEPAAIAEMLAPFRELGFRTVICRLPAPHDRETIDRIGEVADALGG
jgi:alkanesulfonate monooxygenase SsuD/methylene tetrahydromethanopterin reductase-like flavin-dependent oxidoreductase (luciferase family)